MDSFKKICKALLFPHLVIRILLLPIAIASLIYSLIYSLIFLDSESPIAIISYVLSAYTLAVWCVHITAMAIYMIVQSTKKLKLLKAEDADEQ